MPAGWSAERLRDLFAVFEANWHSLEVYRPQPAELDLLTDLLPRKQILLKRPDVAKVLNLCVDPKSYWLYTNTPLDNARVQVYDSSWQSIDSRYTDADGNYEFELYVPGEFVIVRGQKRSA